MQAHDLSTVQAAVESGGPDIGVIIGGALLAALAIAALVWFWQRKRK